MKNFFKPMLYAGIALAVLVVAADVIDPNPAPPEGTDVLVEFLMDIKTIKDNCLDIGKEAGVTRVENGFGNLIEIRIDCGKGRVL